MIFKNKEKSPIVVNVAAKGISSTHRPPSGHCQASMNNNQSIKYGRARRQRQSAFNPLAKCSAQPLVKCPVCLFVILNALSLKLHFKLHYKTQSLKKKLNNTMTRSMKNVKTEGQHKLTIPPYEQKECGICIFLKASQNVHHGSWTKKKQTCIKIYKMLILLANRLKSQCIQYFRISFSFQ